MLKKLLLSVLKVITLSYLLLIGFAWGVSDSLIFLPPEPGYTHSGSLISIASFSNESSTSHSIIAEYKINPAATYTILYSHGNAIDLSGLKNLQQKFYNHNYSVIMYDYSGYGLSSGQPSEQQTYNDSQAVYNYLINKAGISPDKIIIYGHSLGTAVATNLATNNPSASLILESPFLSAFRVKTLYPILPFDKFDNTEKISALKTPVLILHGEQDTIVPVWHSHELFKLASKPKQLKIFKAAGHANITHQGDVYWQTLALFLQQNFNSHNAKPFEPALSKTFFYQCNNNYAFTASIKKNSAWLFLPSNTIQLHSVPSASGAKFTGQSTTFWSKGQSARLTVDEQNVFHCTNNAMIATWEHAKLNGVDFRAIGNEPGWNLEIINAGDISLNTNYGLNKYKFKTPVAMVNQAKEITIYSASDNKHKLDITIEKKPCSDTMSDQKYFVSVTINIDNKILNGCGKSLH